MSYQKYKRFPPINLTNRKWPNSIIEKAPIWCSVDLRDGNQALPEPMTVEEKTAFFNLLLKMGFKEIEVGFPSASETEFNFIRKLIEDKMIPDDVAIQVLTQSRKDLIEKSFASLVGVKKAIMHLYNSTSILQRKVVFKKDKKEIIKIAVEGATLIKEFAEKQKNTDIIYEYSPESFTGTELDFALEICEAVVDIWQPTKSKKMILNLPSTVELATPNVYADQIEWFSSHVKKRDSLIISLHAHNDRGTSVAASELALMAGGDRVEGTLFGNGERTGNADIVTIAMNLFSQGVNPNLDFSNITEIIDIFEKCTKIPVHIRHPYAGELVYTAFSGSHQDAIKKGLEFIAKEKPQFWEVPYLPIDPGEVGRKYEAIIRINSQSGKGGVAYIMESEFGYKLPKTMHPEFGEIIKKVSDSLGTEITPEMILEVFKKEYLDYHNKYTLKNYAIEEKEGSVAFSGVLLIKGKEIEIKAPGNGPIDAFFNSLKQVGVSGYNFISYDEHSLSEGSDSKAVAYIQLEDQRGNRFFGVGVHPNISAASLNAILSAINRAQRK